MVQAQLAAPLLAGAGQLLAVLGDSKTGLAFLLSSLSVSAAIIGALQPGAQDQSAEEALCALSICLCG